MSFSLLSTKLYIPPARTGAVVRPRLLEKLQSGVQHAGSFTLLSGPAGFGKTTLLSEFAAQVQMPVAWLSLDEGDNDPNRFWTYLIAACQTALPGVGETALGLLRSPQPLPDDTIPTLMINDLANQDHPLVLILDDLHTVQNPSIHDGLLFLLDHLPPNLHPIVATRTDPPWPLARRRSRNLLVEIRAQELRFSLEEAAAFLNQTMGLSLSAETLAALEERTEGWVAGLQLAALSMQGRSDVEAFVRAFTGSHVYIAEYLVDEVLKRLPEEMQAFLLRTSILARLTARLCEAVTGCADGQRQLVALQQANIFIVPLDDEGLWFRIHHLFADLLRARLQNDLPKAGVAELHRRAADWYEQNGMIAEAVEHALAAADYAHGVKLVEAAALPMIMQAHVGTVEGWLRAIPAEYFEKSPRINLAYAWMNLLRGLAGQAAPYIDRLRNIFASPETGPSDPSIQAEWLAVQSEHFIAQGKPEESRNIAIQAQALLPAVDPIVRTMVSVALAKAYQYTLDYDRAAEVFQMIVQDARRVGDIAFEVLGASGQAQMVLKQGHLRQTHEIASEAIRRLDASGKKVPFSATLYGELGEVYFNWRQFDRAREYLRRSMEISGKSGYSDPEIYFRIALSKIALMEGDLDGCVREMEQANRIAGIIPPAMIRMNVIAQQVRVDLATGRPETAEGRIAAEGFNFGGTFTFPALAPGSPVSMETGLLYNSALRILLARPDRSDLKRGIDLAEAVIAGEMRCQHLPVALETLLILSQMYAALGEAERSRAAVTRTLDLAQPEGFITPFVEEGERVAAILAGLRKDFPPGDARREILEAVLAAFPNPPIHLDEPGAPSAPRSRGADQPPLVEPLTARELEVLRLIAAGDSNQAIADKLTVTVSAVKKHTGNIYGKLAVSSRTQAISRARQLGLLSPDA